MKFLPAPGGGRLLATIAVIFVAAASSIGVNAQETYPDLYGPGAELLQFDAVPDGNELIWQIHEPERADEHWAVSVYNDSDSTISNIRASIWYEIDGEWYLSGLDNADMFLLPATVAPGGAAYSVGKWLGHNPEDWNDVRIQDITFSQGESTTVVATTIRNLSDDGRSGTLSNDSSQSLENVGVQVACVDSEGRLVNEFYNGIDLRKLDPGAVEPFSFSDANGECPVGTEILVQAAGVVRE